MKKGGARWGGRPLMRAGALVMPPPGPSPASQGQES
jgi:hypothetical protein